MASSTSPLAGQPAMLPLRAIARLARWRFKRMWRFLLVAWLGMLAMVILACAGPLFELVATGASIRSQLAGAPDGSYVNVDVISTQPTSEQLQQITQLTTSTLQQGTLGRYLQGAPQVIVQTPPLDLLNHNQTVPAAFDLVGYDSTQAAQHTTLLRGRLPQVTSDGTLEIALWQEAASNLSLRVGSLVQGRFPVNSGSQVWRLRVVGLVAPTVANDSFWAVADPFSKSSVSLSSRYYFKHDGAPSYNVLTASQALVPKIKGMQAAFTGGSSTNIFIYFLRYPFDLSHFDSYDLPALSQQVTSTDNRFQQTVFRNMRSSELAYANIFGTLWPALEFSNLSGSFGQIAVTFLLLLTLALALFLVSLMTDMLVEWQAAAIATLRSRGATRRHIFGAFAVQGVAVSLAALLAGPPLALLLVSSLAPTLLAPDNREVVAVLTAHPLASLQAVQWYALGASGVALLALLLALKRATGLDIISFRREAARSQRVPFWRRFYLDLFLVAVLLVGYSVYAYIWSLLSQSSARIDPVLYNLLTNIGFFAAPLVVPAVLMLFLRLFPHLTRLATWLAAKRRGAPAVLALAQMERAPRAAERVIVLLALAISSACFLSTLIASQAQRNLDLATFAAQGADFSGSLPPAASRQSWNQLMTAYKRVQGVQSVTLGYQDVIQLGANQDAAGQGTLTVSAVDPTAYAHTVIWPATYSAMPLDALMQQLAAHRAAGLENHVVYALVDLATWQRLHLTPGARFVLPADSSLQAHITYIALAQVNVIPGVYDTPSLSWSGMGLLVDYQGYIAAKAQATGKDPAALAPNALWLRTNGTKAALVSVRKTLPGLNDLHQTLATIQNDPNYLGVIGVVALGIVAALVLALIGSFLLSWLSATNRLTSFAVVRALGMEPRQLAAVLLWEQGFIAITGLLLGLGLGALLTIFVGPIVGILAPGIGLDPGFNVPPIQLAIPYGQLALILGAVALISLLALLFMARLVSRPSLDKTLRLNED